MVDSVKNYGLAGIGATVELGKNGAKIVGGSDDISLKDSNNNLITAKIANATIASHAVSKAQMDAETSGRLQVVKETVTYNGGTQYMFTVPAGTKILSVTVEKGAGNWTGYDSTTNITVGDANDNSRLFGVGWEPDSSQQVDETNHIYTTETEIYAYVTAGSASAGTATITFFFSGSDIDQSAP